MATTPPLSYPTWKSVIPHMSVAQRLFLSKRCPSLSKLNNTIPLRVQHIQVTERGISINHDEATYKVGVITIHPNHTPHDIQIANAAGGKTKDVRQFEDSYEADQTFKELEEDIEKQQNLIENQLNYEQTEWTKRLLRAFENKIVKLRAEIEEVRKNGYTSQYSYYLQLICKTKFGEKVERVKYMKSLSGTRSHLLRKLLPETMLVQVETCELNNPRLILRRNIRILVYPDYATNIQFRGKEAELHFIEVAHAKRAIGDLLKCRYLSEKEITVGMVNRSRGDAVMEYIRALPGAKMSETPRTYHRPYREPIQDYVLF